jgi:tetraacyldisaccharide 4'-kinase
VGDEPWLIQRRTGVPVWVGRDRLAAAVRCARQTRKSMCWCWTTACSTMRWLHDAAVVVFDERGVGNGALLPAGPLREPMPSRAANWRVLYTAGQRSTPWPGEVAQRQIRAMPGRWPPGTPAASRCQPLQAPARAPADGRRRHGGAREVLRHAAGAGLHIERLPLPDHHPYDTCPGRPAPPRSSPPRRTPPSWRRRAWATAVWVVPLDLQLPDGLAAELLALLHRAHHFPPMSLDHRLIDLLVCPVCKGPLQMRRDAEQRPTRFGLPGRPAGLPIRDGIPVMLESEALPLDGPAAATVP